MMAKKYVYDYEQWERKNSRKESGNSQRNPSDKMERANDIDLINLQK